MRWIVLVAMVCGACSKAADDGPTCDQVVDNMMAVTKQQLTGHGGMELGNRKAMVDQCVARHMPAAQRRCLTAAKDLGAIASCSKPAPAANP